LGFLIFLTKGIYLRDFILAQELECPEEVSYTIAEECLIVINSQFPCTAPMLLGKENIMLFPSLEHQYKDLQGQTALLALMVNSYLYHLAMNTKEKSSFSGHLFI